MTVLLYFLNTLCHAGQNTLGKQYARAGGTASVFNMNKAAAGLILLGILGLTSILVSFSLLIPFFFGICFWNESITLWGICGILLRKS